jgi:hypothetical protein
MAKVTLDEVLEGMKALAPDEQRKLWEALNTFLESSPPPSLDDELQQKLLAACRRENACRIRSTV